MRKISEIVAALVLTAFVVAINVVNLREAFGNGPPYYSRTTNMDKWSNPVPMLLALDVATVIAVALIARWAAKRRAK